MSTETENTNNGKVIHINKGHRKAIKTLQAVTKQAETMIHGRTILQYVMRLKFRETSHVVADGFSMISLEERALPKIDAPLYRFGFVNLNTAVTEIDQKDMQQSDELGLNGLSNQIETIIESRADSIKSGKGSYISVDVNRLLALLRPFAYGKIGKKESRITFLIPDKPNEPLAIYGKLKLPTRGEQRGNTDALWPVYSPEDSVDSVNAFMVMMPMNTEDKKGEIDLWIPTEGDVKMFVDDEGKLIPKETQDNEQKES